MMPEGPADNWIAIGRIRTSHGVHGEVKILSYSGEFEHFERLKNLNARKGTVNKMLEIESCRWSGDNLLLKFKGYDQLETAKTLADFEVWVAPELAAPLKAGEYYLRDLVGCQLLFAKSAVGEVTGFLDGAGATELLEVKTTAGKVCVVPFAEVYLGDIDLLGRTIELKVDWILA